MGLVVTCDNPKCETPSESMDANKTVKVFVAVQDPETGSAEKTVFFCVPCGDNVLNILESAGINDLE